MTLEEKGPIVPPPTLKKFPQQVSTEIQSWKKIIAATHWEINDNTSPNGADFYVGNEELGHIHLDGEVHIPIGKKISEKLIKMKLAKKFMYSNDWITSAIETKEDVSHATWLFKLNYTRILKKDEEKLFLEIEEYSKNKSLS